MINIKRKGRIKLKVTCYASCILLELLTSCIDTRDAIYRDAYFDPSKCIVHLDTNSYFHDISVQYKDELLFIAKPKNRSTREFCPCSPDTSTFIIEKSYSRKYLDILKFSMGPDYSFDVDAIKNDDPQKISIIYFFDMVKIKSKTQLYYADGKWML